ncbi:hypothetical protein M7I_8134 [Glarea lozoyensis 74030]|uniref:Uncharacterized protein n=1 Tax=Glarea lozoyensis (strain ATCC 74030 / MF5533) TaxID=1104152 RepID=H0EZ72_GLAL7|nr:hypothetical protein M7I_8134 [Glarea lozoyensis 74030]
MIFPHQSYAEREQHIWRGIKEGNKADIITHNYSLRLA